MTAQLSITVVPPLRGAVIENARFLWPVKLWTNVSGIPFKFIYIHTQKSSRILIKSNRNQVLFTIDWSIWNRTNVRLIPKSFLWLYVIYCKHASRIFSFNRKFTIILENIVSKYYSLYVIFHMKYVFVIQHIKEFLHVENKKVFLSM